MLTFIWVAECARYKERSFSRAEAATWGPSIYSATFQSNVVRQEADGRLAPITHLIWEGALLGRESTVNFRPPPFLIFLLHSLFLSLSILRLTSHIRSGGRVWKLITLLVPYTRKIIYQFRKTCMFHYALRYLEYDIVLYPKYNLLYLLKYE